MHTDTVTPQLFLTSGQNPSSNEDKHAHVAAKRGTTADSNEHKHVHVHYVTTKRELPHTEPHKSQRYLQSSGKQEVNWSGALKLHEGRTSHYDLNSVESTQIYKKRTCPATEKGTAVLLCK